MRESKNPEVLTDSAPLISLLGHDAQVRDLNTGRVLIGVDEVGLGCIAGPVIAAAVHIPDLPDIEMLKTALKDLNDSKKLTPKKRENLAPRIRQIVLFAIATASLQEINLLGIDGAALLAMTRAVQDLLRELSESDVLVLVDGPDKLPDYPKAQMSIKKGDSLSACIAAASVIAKVHRDRIMSAYALVYPGYHWEKNCGYATLKHIEAIKALGLSPIHRASYACLDEFVSK